MNDNNNANIIEPNVLYETYFINSYENSAMKIINE